MAQMHKSSKTIPYFLYIILFYLIPTDVHAFQTHGNPEGLYVHQAAHLLFAASCSLFYRQMQQIGLINQDGWHSIGNGILYLIIWNLWTITGHVVEEMLPASNIHRELPSPTIYLDSWVAWAYVVLKCDHLLCVPGMYFIYKGIKRIADSPDLIPRFPK